MVVEEGRLRRSSSGVASAGAGLLQRHVELTGLDPLVPLLTTCLRPLRRAAPLRPWGIAFPPQCDGWLRVEMEVQPVDVTVI